MTERYLARLDQQEENVIFPAILTVFFFWFIFNAYFSRSSSEKVYFVHLIALLKMLMRELSQRACEKPISAI